MRGKSITANFAIIGLFILLSSFSLIPPKRICIVDTQYRKSCVLKEGNKIIFKLKTDSAQHKGIITSVGINYIEINKKVIPFSDFEFINVKRIESNKYFTNVLKVLALPAFLILCYTGFHFFTTLYLFDFLVLIFLALTTQVALMIAGLFVAIALFGHVIKNERDKFYFSDNLIIQVLEGGNTKKCNPPAKNKKWD